MSAPNLRVVASKLVIRNAFTRLPFRFGVVTMEAAPVALLEVEVEFGDGGRVKGVASDFLAYKWFDKRPEKSPADNVADLLTAIGDARGIYADTGSGTPFGLWADTNAEIERRTLERGFNRLGASFAGSMMERAVIDATGRHLGLGFDAMVRSNALGLTPERILPEVGFDDVLGALPDRPLTRVALRHTVGLVDAISRADMPADAPDDGFPVTLEDYLAVDELRYLKVKVGGDIEADIARLTAIADVVNRCGRPVKMTLDGNEQYNGLEAFVDLVEAIKSTPALADLWASVLFVEQPLHRDVAMATRLSATAMTAIGRPLLIDEADGWPTAYREAIELGYGGASHKNCKGVYHSMINAGLTETRNRAAGEKRYFLSGEDLTNLATVPLQADLCVVATLGISHVERNGHHYFAGLDHLPHRERENALSRHPDLYERHKDGVALRITGGMLEIGSLQVPGLGVVDLPDLGIGIPEADWDFSMLETGHNA
ncbi:MAG: mandelate racemase [Alphaproteobacteria bacterium]|nr:mandelate racemase [Alphaproteobacteria bacterium]